MNAYNRKGQSTKTINVPTRDGKWRMRTTSTRDPVTAKRMQRMVDDLGPRGARAQDLLDRVLEGTLSLAELYDRWIACDHDIERLREQLADVDLEPLIKDWIKAISGSVGDDTLKHYVHHVRNFIPEGKPFPRSNFVSDRIQHHIDELDASSATKRKVGAAISSFAGLLRRRRILTGKVMRDVELPPAGKPRIHYLETPEAKALADAQPHPYSAFSALLAGSGIEVTVALGLRRRDVDLKHREIRAAGTKTHSRDRIVRVAEWAWEYVEPLLPGLLPDARLFTGIPDRWYARDVHVAAIKGKPAGEDSPAVIGLEERSRVYSGYTMRGHSGGAGSTPAWPRKRRPRAQGLRSIYSGSRGARSMGKDRSCSRRIAAKRPGKNAGNGAHFVIHKRAQKPQYGAQYNPASPVRLCPPMSPRAAGHEASIEGGCLTHNAGVAGSSPAPATIVKIGLVRAHAVRAAVRAFRALQNVLIEGEPGSWI
jgi:integrase